MSEQTPKSIISELAAAAGLQTLEKYAEVDNKKQRLFIGIPREIAFQENRVPLTPDSVETLVAQGHRIVIETKAGEGARFSDKDYSEAGAQIYYDRKQVFEADIILKVTPPTEDEMSLFKHGQILILHYIFLH